MTISRTIALTQVHVAQSELMAATAALMTIDEQRALATIETAINALTSAQRHVRGW